MHYTKRVFCWLLTRRGVGEGGSSRILSPQYRPQTIVFPVPGRVVPRPSYSLSPVEFPRPLLCPPSAPALAHSGKAERRAPNLTARDTFGKLFCSFERALSEAVIYNEMGLINCERGNRDLT